MAIIKACAVKNTVKNTGKQCDVVMGATAMLIAVPRATSFVEADMAVPITFFKDHFHAVKADRWYPFFGNEAPIRTITNNQEADAIVTLDDGSQVFLRYGFYNREFETTSGGLCYAEALQSFNRSGYRILEIDQEGKMLIRDNKDGTYSGMISDFMHSPSPILADFKTTPYKNRFRYSMAPNELVNYGKVFDGAEDALGMMGLQDAKVTKAAAATTTKLKIGVQTECSEVDLVDAIGAPLAATTNFIVTNKATGVVVSISAAAIVTGWIELTGVFTSGQTYVVSGTDAHVLYLASIEGYEIVTPVEILIP